ncbi:MAG TPA: thiamine pyrophosphate-binding protein [Methylomirabilota bacterium]|jgi:acetolactate synthase-1/2/3 large subunit
MPRVADVLADGLSRAGATRAFVAPGAPRVLVEAVTQRGLGTIDAPDGAAACVLAAVTGELTDAPGVTIAPLAEAAALTPGLALAARDCVPLILVSDLHADLALLGPVVKASLVVEPASAGHWIAHAANLALTEPRGPVHVACAAAVAGEASLPMATACRPGPLPAPAAASLEALAGALSATRPVIVTGRECTGDDAGWVRAFAESLPAPVLATPKGRGTLPEPHPLSLGLLAAGHPLLARADLALLVGVDAGELPPGILPPALPLARMARAPWPDAAPRPAADVVGDIALVIEELAPRVKARAAADWDVAALDRVKRALAAEALAAPAARLVRVAREATPAGTVATADVPLGLAWQAVAPRETLTPLGGHAPAGYAILAAIAAQLVDPARRVVAFTTPMGLAAGGGALAMAGARALPIVVVVLGGAHDEEAFARDFARALASGGPTVVAA